MKILVACEESQRVTSELRRLGHEAYSCDSSGQTGGHPEWHIKGDVTTLLNGNKSFATEDGAPHTVDGEWDMIIAFPPCTYLSNAGVCRLYKKIGNESYIEPERLKKGIEARIFFEKILSARCEKIAIENPVPTKIYSLPPWAQIIQPYEYGDPYKKRTCLWLKGLDKLRPTNIVKPVISWVSGGSKRHDGTPRDNMGMKFRDSTRKSKTFPGIARAMAEQWAGDVNAQNIESLF